MNTRVGLKGDRFLDELSSSVGRSPSTCRSSFIALSGRASSRRRGRKPILLCIVANPVMISAAERRLLFPDPVSQFDQPPVCILGFSSFKPSTCGPHHKPKIPIK
jgi:hypothetical protein